MSNNNARGKMTKQIAFFMALLAISGLGSCGGKGKSSTNGTPNSTAPAVALSATSTSIAIGASTTVSWSSTNCTSCTSPGGGGTGTTGSFNTGALTTTTTYTVTCSGANGSSSQNITIMVVPASLTVGYNHTTATVTAATVVLDLAQPSLGNYPVWVSGDGFPGLIRAATHQVLPGGHFGRGFSRFTPGDFNDGVGGRGEHYCGIGQIHGFNTVGDSSMMVVGQLIRYGTSFFTDQAAKRPPDGSIKQLILIKDVGGSGSRPMLVTKGENTPSGTKVLAACNGTVCNTTNDINNIDYFNDGNHQPNLNDYLGQWLWVEFAVNTNIPFIRVRTWSADGVLSGAETIAPWGAGGRITDLDVISFVNGIVTLGPQPYFDLERIEFRIGSDNNITPPAGFPGSAR